MLPCGCVGWAKSSPMPRATYLIRAKLLSGCGGCFSGKLGPCTSRHVPVRGFHPVVVRQGLPSSLRYA